MKQIKRITESHLYTYVKNGSFLGGKVSELRDEHSIHLGWYGDTYSVGGSLGDPSGIFFEEDVLNQPDYYTLKDEERKPHDQDCEFIKVPIEFEGREYEGWITTKKFGNFSSTDIQRLEAAFPQYFCDEPQRALGFFDEDYAYGRDKFELHLGDSFVTSTEEVRDPLYRKGCWLASNTLFRIERIDNIYTTREIPCTGGFDPGDYEPENYNVKYEVVRHEDNIEFIVLKGKLNDLRDYFDDVFYTEDDDDGYNWFDYSPVDPPARYPKIIYSTFEHDQPYDPNNIPRIVYRDVSYWCGDSDDGEVPIEEYESDINIPGAISYFNNEKVEPPQRKLGFFDENLNESINRNFTTDDQIREIMENQNLSIEQKSTKLFDRSSHHVWMFAMCSYNYPQETLNYAEEHTGSTSDLRNADTRPIEEVGESYYIGGRTLMVLGRETEPFNLEESYEYYVLGRTEKYGRRTNDYPMEPLGWWKYIKACVEVYETAAGYKGKQLGFFDD